MGDGRASSLASDGDNRQQRNPGAMETPSADRTELGEGLVGCTGKAWLGGICCWASEVIQLDSLTWGLGANQRPFYLWRPRFFRLMLPFAPAKQKKGCLESAATEPTTIAACPGDAPFCCESHASDMALGVCGLRSRRAGLQRLFLLRKEGNANQLTIVRLNENCGIYGRPLVAFFLSLFARSGVSFQVSVCVRSG